METVFGPSLKGYAKVSRVQLALSHLSPSSWHRALPRMALGRPGAPGRGRSRVGMALTGQGRCSTGQDYMSFPRGPHSALWPLGSTIPVDA